MAQRRKLEQPPVQTKSPDHACQHVQTTVSDNKSNFKYKSSDISCLKKKLATLQNSDAETEETAELAVSTSFTLAFSIALTLHFL